MERLRTDWRIGSAAGLFLSAAHWSLFIIGGRQSNRFVKDRAWLARWLTLCLGDGCSKDLIYLGFQASDAGLKGRFRHLLLRRHQTT